MLVQPTIRRPTTIPDEAEADAAHEAFADLYRAHGRRVYAFVRYRVGDGALAEDLTAEVFARAWARRGQLRSPEATVAWLFATARNLVTDHRRRRPDPLPLGALPPEAHPLAGSPEPGAVLAAQLAEVRRLLADLGDREREAIGLRFVAGLRNGEIALVLGTSEGNVAKILHRALRKLRERLPKEEPHAL